MKSKLKNFSLLTISTLIMAVGIYFFKFANNFTFGGITGIAVLVAKFLPISASDFSFVVNILLLIIGWIVLGKSFAEKNSLQHDSFICKFISFRANLSYESSTYQ